MSPRVRIECGRPSRRARHVAVCFAVCALVSVLLLAEAALYADIAEAQNWGRRGRRGGWGAPPRAPTSDMFKSNVFTFCRIMYTSVRDEAKGYGWTTDYPDSDYNFMIRLAELTTIAINRDANGDPLHVTVRMTDEEILDYPFTFMSDVGTVGMTEREVEGLRRYLLNGGFLHVDDFWGEAAWTHWETQIGRVLPPDRYPIMDIPLSDDIFRIVFHVKEVPQVPSIQHWRQVGRDSSITSERGLETATPHMRGIRNEAGHWIVIMTHNTDIADGWEREAENHEYFKEFSVKKSYPLGINIVVYALTH